MNDKTRPILTAINGTPAKILYKSTMMQDALYVQCMTSIGEVAYVPLTEIFKMFTEEMAKQARLQEGLRQ
jgi:hypothetical protein